MSADLFAGTPVTDLEAAVAWYTRLLGADPAFWPNDSEAVFEIAPDRHLFLERRSEGAGYARHLVFLDDLAGQVSAAASRGLNPVKEQSLGGGVSKVSYADPDGNLFEFGGRDTST